MSNGSRTNLLDYGLTNSVTVIYILLGLVTVLTNGVFMLVVWRHRHLKSDTNWILFSLALSDLLVGAFVTPLNLINFLSSFHIHEILCIALNCCLTCMPLVSLFHLLAVAGERYVGIIYSIHHSRIVTTRRTVIVLTVCWILGVGIGVLPVFGWNRLQERQEWNVTQRVCSFTLVFPTYYIRLFIYVLISVYMIVCAMYVRIFAVAFGQSHKFRGSFRRCRANSDIRRARNEIRVIIVLFMTVGYFLVSYLPACIMCIQLTYGYETSGLLWRVLLFLAFSNSAVNPFIYGLGNRTIRLAFIGMFCNCKCRPCSNTQTNGTDKQIAVTV